MDQLEHHYRGKVLVLDDDELLCDVIQDHLRGQCGLEVLTAYTGAAGLEAIREQPVDVVLLDQMLPDAKGHELCPKIIDLQDDIKIVFITAHPSFSGAVEAIRAGAHDYLSKPFDLEELTLAVNRTLDLVALEKVAHLQDYNRTRETAQTVLVDGGGLAEVKNLVALASSERAPVLITGETGTGKNLVAKAIHYKSANAKMPFVTINCSAIPESLIEAELFGHAKGAFTGAVGAQKGIFEMAEGGTLFLDEIGDMPINMQTKLLGVLEDKIVRRIGGETFHKVDVRILAATSTALDQALGSTFRTDLFYRLSVIAIHIPPLRERPGDIGPLCAHLMTGAFSGSQQLVVDEVELRKLQAYDWPGNVRELKNILERAAILGREREVRPSHLLGVNQTLRAGVGLGPADARAADDEVLPLAEIERRHILNTLQRKDNNLTHTAKALGISLSTLKRKLKAYSLG